MRLDKFLANQGYGSRKEVKALIKQKRVSVNDEIAKRDDVKIDEFHDVVKVDDETVAYEEFVYYMLYKPAGYVSATEDRLPTVMDLFEEFIPKDSFPVGRLDIDTEGLLLISNDGVLAHRLLSPKKHVDKVYEVHTAKPIDDGMVERLQKPLVYQDEVYQGGRVEKVDEHILYLTIQEGKFEQVKRMLLCVGNEVTYLKRIRFGSLVLDESLKKGQYRRLSEEELETLKNWRNA